MARGKEEYAARMNVLSGFGKDLARRAKSRCELCSAAGEKLSVYEVPPERPVPEFERCVLLCSRCEEAFRDPRKFEGGDQWRCLGEAAWSALAPVQVLAVRLLQRLGTSEDWAREALDGLYLDEEVEEWVTEEG